MSSMYATVISKFHDFEFVEKFISASLGWAYEEEWEGTKLRSRVSFALDYADLELYVYKVEDDDGYRQDIATIPVIIVDKLDNPVIPRIREIASVEMPEVSECTIVIVCHNNTEIRDTLLSSMFSDRDIEYVAASHLDYYLEHGEMP